MAQREHRDSVHESAQEYGTHASTVSRSRSCKKKARTRRRSKKKLRTRDPERPEAASPAQISPLSPASEHERHEKCPPPANDISPASGTTAAAAPPIAVDVNVPVIQALAILKPPEPALTSEKSCEENKGEDLGEERSKRRRVSIRGGEKRRDKQLIVRPLEPASSLVEAQTVGKMLRHEFPITTSITDLTIRSPTFCASVFVLISLSSVLLLFALFMPTLKKLFDRCSTADCRRATEELELLMDAEVEPCSDFYHHVCNKWLAKHADGMDLAHVTLSDSLKNAQRLLLEQDRETDNNQYGLSATSQLVAVFVPCFKFMTSSADIVDRNLVQTARSNLDVLLSRTVNEALQRVVQLSLLRGISTLFHVSVVRHNGENATLYISQAVPLTEKLKETTHSATLPQFLEEILNAAAHALPDAITGDVSTTALRLIDFDKDVYAVEPEGMLVKMAAVSNRLAKLAGGDDFVRLVNSLLPETWKLSNNSLVFCTGLHSIESALVSFRGQYKLGLLYIFVHVLVEIGQFYDTKQLLQKKPTDAKNTCLEASRDVMSPRLWSAAFNALTIRGSAAERVVDMFEHIRRLSSLLPLLSGMDEEEKRHVLSALSSVQLLHHNVSSYAHFNDSVSVGSVNISADFGILYQPLKTLESSRRLAEPPYIEDVLQNRYAMTSDATYLRLLNAVVFPVALWRPPFVYSGQVPVEFDLATAGTVLTRSVFQASMPSARSVVTWRTENVAHFVHCAERASHLHGPLRELSPNQALDLFAWTRSVRIAHWLMTDHYEVLRNTTTSEYDRDLAQRTFFRRFCLSTCNAVGNNDSDVDARLRCLFPILSMPEFFSSFSCVFPEAENLRRCLDFEHH
ncbi:hypothetical protein HPB49_021714 [Dermacentor silvarum]|uniref:Uncharacterized protein n=1 Tax=Dermacentor silvarum TaxID=543639 RepID=A0ACB8CN27_DERSI|nr:hypothetical protein HPB49_021714 [Dermacentor silvarum]